MSDVIYVSNEEELRASLVGGHKLTVIKKQIMCLLSLMATTSNIISMKRCVRGLGNYIL